MNYKGEVKEVDRIKKQLIGAMINQSVASVASEPSMFADELEMNNMDISLVKSGSKKGVSPESLAQRWKIGLDLAKKTVKVTTQLCVQSGKASLN